MNQEQGQSQSFPASRQDLSTPAHDIQLHHDASLVKVEISYPSKYEGQKMYSEGSTQWVSREVADQFIELGIATEVKRTKEETVKPTAAAEATISTKEANDDKLDAKRVTGTNAVNVDDSAATAIGADAIAGGKAKKA